MVSIFYINQNIIIAKILLLTSVLYANATFTDALRA